MRRWFCCAGRWVWPARFDGVSVLNVNRRTSRRQSHHLLGESFMDASLEASTMRKVYVRLLPFAIICYVLAYIDRINSSFAALTMRGDLKMSAADFGFAVGTFY